MQNFTRMLWMVGFLLTFVVIYLASSAGYGVTPLTDRTILSDSRDGGGYFTGSRSIRGGGMRYGK
ncbi:MAG: hypothetical protein MUC97_16960 [Bernardetiaceae bacterium]|jgi:hypothetical protein|nr:hypothetical protein [Bernardetiaceae bacterium]